MIMDHGIAALLPIFSFFLQSYPRFFNRYFGVDVWTRLLEVEHIRRAGHRIPSERLGGQFIIDGYFDYPPLFPLLLSFFSKDRLLAIQGFVAPFFDALHIVLIYIVTYTLTTDIRLALLAQLLYTLTPMIAIENGYLTPRSFGYLTFSLATIPLVMAYHTASVPLLLLGLVFSTIVFLSHRFATQSFFFLMIFLAIVHDTSFFLRALGIGFFGALLFTRGYYLRVLKGHLANIYFWVGNLPYRFAHQVRGLAVTSEKKDFVAEVYKLLAFFSPIALFATNPWASSGLIALVAVYLGWLVLPPILLTFAIWVTGMYLLAAVVMRSKILMPIGEGYRYLEMATMPAVILSVMLLSSLFTTRYASLVSVLLLLLLLANLAIILFFQRKTIITDRNRTVTDDLATVFAMMNRMKKQLRVLCIPHQNTTMTIYHTKAAVFVNADNPGLLRIQDVYPILRLPLGALKEKYGLTHVLIKTSFVTLKELKLAKKDIVFESGDVKLVAL